MMTVLRLIGARLVFAELADRRGNPCGRLIGL